MNRNTENLNLLMKSMPHVCGDEPSLDLVHLVYVVYAPRMWG